MALYSCAQWNLEVAISLWLDKGLVGSDAWNDSGLSERQSREEKKEIWAIVKYVASSPTPNPILNVF